MDTWAERLQEEVNTLIEERKFSSRDAKEVKTIGEILEADTLREAQEISFQRLKLLYIANTKGWSVAQKYQREDLEAAFGILGIDDKPITDNRSRRRDKRGGRKTRSGRKAAPP